MNDEPLSHHANAQTTPDIFAAYVHYGIGASEEGSYHQWTISLTIAGQCNWRSSGQPLLLTSGHLIVTRPHMWTALRIPAGEAEWEAAYAVFHPRPHWLPWLDSLNYQAGTAHVRLAGSAKAEVQRAMIATATAYNSRGEMRDERTLLALENALIVVCLNTERQTNSLDTRVRDATEFIHGQFQELLTISQIAQVAGLSVTHFTFLFTTSMGMTPMQYLERYRLSHAAEMLRFGAASVGDIARVSGFAEQNYFAYRFRLHYGQSPTEYRRFSRPILQATQNQSKSRRHED